MELKEQIDEVVKAIPHGVTLVAVSKTHPTSKVMEAYEAGLRIFGESRPQELKAKYESLPKDIRWHMIGHLQTNKVKYIAPFVELIHSVDSERLLDAINKEGWKNGRVIDVLLEIHIAEENSKSGWELDELVKYLDKGDYKLLTNIRIRGLMGIATFTDNTEQVRMEFGRLHDIFTTFKKERFGKDFDTLSMGMTADWQIAVECGANMVRIGSLIFGAREQK